MRYGSISSEELAVLTMPTEKPMLLPVEREYLMKERASLIERIRFVENRLNMPSSLIDHHLRRAINRAINQAPEDDTICSDR
jgi:hypothetical protein